MIVVALLLVGVLSVGVIDTVYAQIAQPIAQTGGGVSIAQPISQGGFAGTSVISAPFVSNRIMPGYSCYQQFPGGPFTCYPERGAYISGGVYQYPGGIIQPVQQTGFGTQVAAPVAVI